MINREFRKAILRSYAGVDAYGQMLSTSVDSREIDITFGLYNHTETSDVRYQEATHYGLTKEKDINDKQTLAIEGIEYKIIFVNPYGRLTQIFMRKK
jgi:hypothetical protein